MDKNFSAIAFSTSVKKMQEKLGSRSAYARVEKNADADGLTENEIDFISLQDSFYMASIGESGFPYIQHRGGAKGFLKVLDNHRLGFVDFRGNKQYISVGNIATNNKVALIMVDYPSRTRLKIYAKATVVDLKDDPDLFNLLNVGQYKSQPERMMILEVQAYDWNCQQHIVPRYTIPEINEAFAPQVEYIKRLEAEIENLKQKLESAKI
ncbi:MAG: pyridoxamine 5'-phosphate oxidase family protein [Bacteroidetes bacterium]|nr:pyridoxamine 5'-phosphate oxidase family protein [Bacteroidota bacterium]